MFWIGFFAVLFLSFALLQGVVLPFAAAFVIAYLLDPLVGRFETWGISRALASLVVLLGFLLGIALILVLLVPLVQGQIVRLLGRFPGLVSATQDQFGNLMELLRSHLPEEEATKVRAAVGEKIGDAFIWFATLFEAMITSSFAILSILSLVVVTPIVAFFMMRDWHRMLAGLDSALALGSLIGVLAIIPVAGVATGFALTVGLAALQYGTWTIVAVVCGIFIFGQTVEANILTPKLVGDRIHLHPVWVIFALFAGGTLYGFVGILLAVPAAAVIGVLIRFALTRYRASGLYDSREPPIIEPPSLEPTGREPPSRVAPFR